MLEVDSEGEAEIQAALAVLMRGRTTIAVAHRLSTIVGADEILVMHHGRVRERGTHRALLTAGGLYERLYRLQIGEPPAEGDGEEADDDWIEAAAKAFEAGPSPALVTANRTVDEGSIR